MTINVVLADDHPLVLMGIERLFTTVDDIKIMASCGDGEQALNIVRRLRPDILILDLNMPRKDGLSVLREMQAEALTTKTVLLTAELNEDRVTEAIRHGVHGVVLKEMAPQLLIQCVRVVYEGGEWLEKRSVKLAFDKLLSHEVKRQQISTVLTPREIHLVEMVARGLSNRTIADNTNISEGTVKTHLHNIYDKLGIKNRVELARYAQEKFLK